MSDFWDNAEFFMPPKQTTVIPENQAVDIIEEQKPVDLPVNTGDKLPVLELGMLGENFTPVETTSTTKDKPDEGKPTPQFSSNTYKALVEELATRYDVEVPTDKEFESSDDVVNFFSQELIDKRIKEGIDAKLDSIGPKAKLYMDLKEYIGDEERTIAVIEDLNFYNSLEDSTLKADSDLQKEVISSMLAVKGMTAEQIQEELTDIEVLGKLDSKAVEAKKFLIKSAETFISKSKAAKLDNDKTFQKQFTDMVDSIEKMSDISGLKVTPEMKTKVKETLTKSVFTDKTGKTYNEVANKQRLYKTEFDKAMSFINVLGLFSFDKAGNWVPDFSKLSSLTTNKIARKLDDAIAEQQRFSKVGGEGSGTSLADVLASL